MLAPALAGLLVFFVYPLIASVYYSFTRYDLVTPPQWIGTRNYEFLFTKDPRVWISAGQHPVVRRHPGARPDHHGDDRRRDPGPRQDGIRPLAHPVLPPGAGPPGRRHVAFVFLFNPGTGPVNLILKSIGIQGPLWFNDPAWSKPSLLLLGVWVMGDIMIIFLAALLDVPQDQYEAASLDGANVFHKVRYVTLPSIFPVIIFAVVTGVIAALQYFTEAAVASGVASGKAVVGEGTGVGLGYPQGSLLTFTEWLYVRGFSQYQLGSAIGARRAAVRGRHHLPDRSPASGQGIHP